jgi:type II secretory pathway component PulL
MRPSTIQVPIEDTREFSRPRRSVNWQGKLGLWAAILVGLPVLGATLLRGVEIWKSPDRIDVLARQQEEMGKQISAQQAAQREIREGLNRILSAMRLDPIKDPKQKESP